MSRLEIVVGLAIVAYLVLMVLVVKWWFFDDHTDRMMNHGAPIEEGEPGHFLVPTRRRGPRNGHADERRHRKAASFRRRMGPPNPEGQYLDL
jgi:hypothetical protein